MDQARGPVEGARQNCRLAGRKGGGESVSSSAGASRQTVSCDIEYPDAGILPVEAVKIFHHREQTRRIGIRVGELASTVRSDVVPHYSHEGRYQLCTLATCQKQNDIFAARVSEEPIDASAVTCIMLPRQMAIDKVVFFFALYTIDTLEKQIDGVNHVAALPVPLTLRPLAPRQQLDISPGFCAGIHVEHYPTKSVLLANLET